MCDGANYERMDNETKETTDIVDGGNSGVDENGFSEFFNIRNHIFETLKRWSEIAKTGHVGLNGAKSRKKDTMLFL